MKGYIPRTKDKDQLDSFVHNSHAQAINCNNWVMEEGYIISKEVADHDKFYHEHKDDRQSIGPDRAL